MTQTERGAPRQRSPSTRTTREQREGPWPTTQPTGLVSIIGLALTPAEPARTAAGSPPATHPQPPSGRRSAPRPDHEVGPTG